MSLRSAKESANLVSKKMLIGAFHRYQMKCKSVSKKSPRYNSLAKEPKRLILIPDGEHIDAFSDRHGDVYREQMVDFILSALNPQN